MANMTENKKVDLTDEHENSLVRARFRILCFLYLTYLRNASDCTQSYAPPLLTCGVKLGRNFSHADLMYLSVSVLSEINLSEAPCLAARGSYRWLGVYPIS